MYCTPHTSSVLFMLRYVYVNYSIDMYYMCCVSGTSPSSVALATRIYKQIALDTCAVMTSAVRLDTCAVRRTNAGYVQRKSCRSHQLQAVPNKSKSSPVNTCTLSMPLDATVSCRNTTRCCLAHNLWCQTCLLFCRTSPAGNAEMPFCINAILCTVRNLSTYSKRRNVAALTCVTTLHNMKPSASPQYMEVPETFNTVLTMYGHAARVAVPYHMYVSHAT